MLELRAGVGGREAGLFASQLLRMYERFAAKMRWRVTLTEVSFGCDGGIKRAVADVVGEGVGLWLAHEAGVHRVQRVPKTETRGRVHTSTVTLALLPSAGASCELGLLNSDLKIETMRASGAGGQHVNTTDSAVRITHLPTGVTACASCRSQHQNRAMALKLLRERVAARALSNAAADAAGVRAAQVADGARAHRARTYSFVMDKVTDHKLGRSVVGVARVLDGELQLLVRAPAPGAGASF
ncbi:putative peptide chain release factor RF1 [Candidatus Hodgkinia cicadicola Dsem]|nr:putative peptide chain release factor RF1 [Candidatus Hodgkinia cicadicola Dsem]